MTATAQPTPPTMPWIGDPAPAFTAVTTQGDITFPVDYAGSWVIFFSHPADFTPVCTTEFMTFASMQEDFAALNTQLVGLSIDGLYSHIAWLRTIKEKITFRLVLLHQGRVRGRGLHRDRYRERPMTTPPIRMPPAPFRAPPQRPELGLSTNRS